MSFRVFVSDRCENTGLDSALFADRADADAALAVLAGDSDYGRYADRACVVEVADSPNTTFKAWNETGW